MAGYRHVLWDWNGTLLDDVEVVVGVMNLLLAPRGLAPLTPERYREVFDFPVRTYYEAIGFDFAAEPFEALTVEWVDRFGAHWRSARLRAGATAALDQIESQGIGSSILSAAEHELLCEQAAYFGVAGRFQRMMGIADHHAESKLEQGRTWLRELGDSPQSVLLVGDTTHDVEVAHALGCDVVLVADGHQSRARLAATGVPVVESLGDVLVGRG